MIIGTAGFQLPPQMPFIYDDNSVQALPPYRADQPLHIGRLPWRARRRIEGESLHQLLSGPFRGGMIRRIEVNDFPPFMMQNDKNIQDFECYRRDCGRRPGEKID